MNPAQQLQAFDFQGGGDAAQRHYRAALGRLAHERDLAIAKAEKATRDLTETLPQALLAGVSVVDAAQLTGLSRPTIYRMLAGARKQHDVRKDLARFEHALEGLDRSALPFDLASYLQISTDEVFECLMRLYPLLSGELASFGPVGLTKLVELLPDLGIPERIVLAMLLLQDLPTERVVWSTKYPETEVLGWAALGLLRILPRIREAIHAPSVLESAEAELRRPSSQLWRYPLGDPRRHAENWNM
ncbi:MAG TPA: hypothetical protein VN892_01355 [Solirubrobacteraceae bacterium]|nr:hypothetical protein [Solirubrobacteraceae bacterium]